MKKCKRNIAPPRANNAVAPTGLSPAMAAEISNDNLVRTLQKIGAFFTTLAEEVSRNA